MVNPTMIYSILKDGIENQDEIKKELFVLDHRDFNYFCSLMGIHLNQNEIDKVFKAFDIDNSKTISYDEFIEFTGPNGSVSEAMKKKCIWDSYIYIYIYLYNYCFCCLSFVYIELVLAVVLQLVEILKEQK